MKKLLTTSVSFILLFLLSINTFAQEEWVEDWENDWENAWEDDYKISFGVQAGMNISSLGGDMEKLLPGSRVSDRKSFHIGVFVDIPFSREVYLQPGLFFTNKGFRTQGEVRDRYGYHAGSYTIKSNATYLQVPVLLSVRPYIYGSLRWHVNFGPYIACGIKGKQKVETTGDVYNQEGTEAIPKSGEFFGTKGDFNRFDVGGIFGTGFSFSNIYVGIQYEMGLLNIANQDAWNGISINNRKPSFKTNNFSVSASYTF